MKLKIPDGFEIKPYGSMAGYDVLTSPPTPHRYYATIDWAKRRFASGMTTIGMNLGKKVYAGRAWRQRLLDDAVKFLKKLEA